MFQLYFKNNVSPTLQYKFMSNVFQMMSISESMIKEINGFINGKYGCDEMLLRCEQLISGSDFTTLVRPGTGAQLLREDSLYWFNYSVGTLNGCFTQLIDYSEIMYELTAEEAEKFEKVIASARGALAYSILLGLDIIRHLNEQELSWEITASEGITAVVQDRFEGSYLEMISYLYKAYVNTPPSVPVRFEFPGQWAEFTDMVEDTEFGKEIIDYGDFLYLPDVEAIVEGKIPLDDTLLDVLKRRENDQFLPGKLFPYKFSRFVQNVPEKYRDILFKYEQVLSEDLLDEAIENGIDDAFIKKLEAAPQLSAVYKNSFVTSSGGILGNA